MSAPRLDIPSWFCPDLTFSNLYETNTSQQLQKSSFNIAKFHRDACFADYISFLVHLIFAAFTIFSLVLMTCYYRTKNIKHSAYTRRFPLHVLRWILCIPLFLVLLASITEGVLSDMKLAEGTSTPNLYLPAVLAFVAGIMAMVFYHYMEIWHQVSMVGILFLYWICALGSEIFCLLKWLDNPDHADVRIMRFDCFIVTVVIYASFLLVECVLVLLQVNLHVN